MRPDDSIQEELKQIAPFLASMQKSHPFKVPENYFDALETSLIALSRLKKHPFNVPDDYFREFPSAVLLKIKNEKEKVNEIKPIIPFTRQLHNYKFWVAAASIALILVVSLSLFTRYHPGEVASVENQGSLPGATMENSYSELLYAADIDESMVVDLYIQDQNRQPDPENSFLLQKMNYEDNYLRDAADIDPYLINEM